MPENENKPEEAKKQNEPKLPFFQVFEVKMTPEVMEQLFAPPKFGLTLLRKNWKNPPKNKDEFLATFPTILETDDYSLAASDRQAEGGNEYIEELNSFGVLQELTDEYFARAREVLADHPNLSTDQVHASLEQSKEHQQTCMHCRIRFAINLECAEKELAERNKDREDPDKTSKKIIELLDSALEKTREATTSSGMKKLQLVADTAQAMATARNLFKNIRDILSQEDANKIDNHGKKIFDDIKALAISSVMPKFMAS